MAEIVGPVLAPVLEAVEYPYLVLGLQTPMWRFIATAAVAAVVQLLMEPEFSMWEGKIRPWALLADPAASDVPPTYWHFVLVSVLAGAAASQL